jgi:hypothetical protein
MKPGLPEIDEEIGDALDAAVPDRYRKQFRAPVLPAELDNTGAPDLAELAVRSPFAVLLERDGAGTLTWDFRHMGAFEHQPGLRSLAVRVEFTDTGGRLGASRIESDEHGAVDRNDPDRDDPEWDASVLLAVCAASTHLALTRHYIDVHLIGGDHWAVATRNHLPPDHPLYRLLWPHIYNSLYTIYGTLRTQVLPEGDFANIFSFTHGGLMDYFDAMYERYDVRLTDPAADHTRRGLDGTGFEQPSHENLLELSEVMNAHTRRYVHASYGSDDELQADGAVVAWLAALDELIPNGVGELLGTPVTRDGLARLVGGHVYEGSVVHDLVGTTLWDYVPWVDRIPPRIARDGTRIPVDVHQRTVNNNFALQIRRAPLLADYGAVAIDEQGAALFTQFHDECAALQERYDRAPAGPWRMEPKNLEIGMNG